MKLHEFVDKIEAMGEVETTTETLNEGTDTTTNFWDDFWDSPEKDLNEALTEDYAQDKIKDKLRDLHIDFYNNKKDFTKEKVNSFYKELKELEKYKQDNLVYNSNIDRDIDNLKFDLTTIARNLYQNQNFEFDESLNESAYDMRDGGLRDEFYSLINGMDPAEVVDMMYWYLDDYAVEDMIKDIKGQVSYTEEETEEE